MAPIGGKGHASAALPGRVCTVPLRPSMRVNPFRVNWIREADLSLLPRPQNPCHSALNKPLITHVSDIFACICLLLCDKTTFHAVPGQRPVSCPCCRNSVSSWTSSKRIQNHLKSPEIIQNPKIMRNSRQKPSRRPALLVKDAHGVHDSH